MHTSLTVLQEQRQTSPLPFFTENQLAKGRITAKKAYNLLTYTRDNHRVVPQYSSGANIFLQLLFIEERGDSEGRELCQRAVNDYQGE